MLNDEQANEQARGGQCEGEGYPVGPIQAEVHEIPQRAKRQQRVDDLPAALEPMRAFEAGQSV